MSNQGKDFQQPHYCTKILLTKIAKKIASKLMRYLHLSTSSNIVAPYWNF